MVNLCQQPLSTGKTCARFALKGQRWCAAHLHPDRRNSAQQNRWLVEAIPTMELESIAWLLHDTLNDLRHRQTTPLHAQTVFEHAAQRLDYLMDNPEAA